MTTPHGPTRPEQALRRSGAAGPHTDRRRRRTRTRQAAREQAVKEQQR